LRGSYRESKSGVVSRRAVLSVLCLVALWLSVAAASARSTVLLEPCVSPPAPSAPTGPVPDDAFAPVGSRPISRASLDGAIAQARRSYREQKRHFPAPGTQLYRDLQQQVVAFLVRRAELAQVAAALGIEVTDAQVTRRVAQITRRYFGGSQS